MQDRLTRDQLKQWLQDPTTQVILRRLKVYRDQESEALVAGGSLCKDSGETAIRTARSVGQIQGLDLIFEIRPDDANEEVENKREWRHG